MKQLLALSFCGLLLISSCTCNDNKDKAETDNIDTMGQIDTQPMDNMNSENITRDAGNDKISDNQFRRMYNLSGYSEDEVREYRRLHDEMDWGTVPGFYPEASTRPLDESDTKYLTKWGHKVMLNEIYARHGMSFDDPDLQEHFSSFGWYNASSSNVDGQLTELEKQNITFLMNHPAS